MGLAVVAIVFDLRWRTQPRLYILSPHRISLLFGYHTTGDAVSGVSRGIGFHVIRLAVDNQRLQTEDSRFFGA